MSINQANISVQIYFVHIYLIFLMFGVFLYVRQLNRNRNNASKNKHSFGNLNKTKVFAYFLVRGYFTRNCRHHNNKIHIEKITHKAVSNNL